MNYNTVYYLNRNIKYHALCVIVKLSLLDQNFPLTFAHQ